jgi:hypothetical protein
MFFPYFCFLLLTCRPKIAFWRELCRVTHCCAKETNFYVGTDFYWNSSFDIMEKEWINFDLWLGTFYVSSFGILEFYFWVLMECPVISHELEFVPKSLCLNKFYIYLLLIFFQCLSCVWICLVGEPSVTINAISSWNCLSYTRISF